MTANISIQIKEPIQALLIEEAASKNIPISDLVSNLLEFHFRMKMIEKQRPILQKYAKEAGFHSEQDVFDQIS
jgi:uncharacterized protein YihD (DUF1040 family)